MIDSPQQADAVDLAELVRVACLLEATARKAGNVHPGASFADLTYDDFCISADAAAVPLSRAGEVGVGQAILTAAEATQAAVGRNTNLGIILLLAPLAAVPKDVPLSCGIGEVLRRLTQDDATLTYQAIRLAKPGGMGRVSAEELSQEPQGTLLDVMRLAADRDQIAAQYVTDFTVVLETGVPYLTRCANFATHWEQTIVGLQLSLLAQYPDTLIARKCGRETALEATRRAKALLLLPPLARGGRGGRADSTQRPQLHECTSYVQLPDYMEFDAWLRADGNRRNPGTTADLITACLFAALRDVACGHCEWPGMDQRGIEEVASQERRTGFPARPN